MKKIFILYIILSSVIYVASGQTATVSIGDYTEDPGTLNIPIDVSNFVDVGAITLFIEYDPNVVSYVSHINGGISNVITYAYPSGEKYTLGISWAEINPVTFDGTLMTLVFNYSGGETNLDFLEPTCEIATIEGVIIPTVYTDGSISPNQVSAVPITIVDQLNLNPATLPGYIDVPIEVDFSEVLPPFGVGSFNFEIAYDENILIFQSLVNVDPSIATVYVNTLSNPSRIALVWNASVVGSTINDTLLEMRFSYVGGNTELNFLTSACEIADFDAQVLNAIYDDGLITQDPGSLPNIIIDSIGAAAGDPIEIPVTVKNFSTVPNLGAFDYSVGFNSSVLEFLSLTEVNEKLGSGLLYNAITDELNIAWSAVSPGITFADDELLFNLKFNYFGSDQDVFFKNENCSMADWDTNPINALYIDGEVTEIPGINATVCMDTVLSPIASEVYMPVTVTGFGDIGAITLEFMFDDLLLNYISIENEHSELGAGSSLINSSGGVLTYSWTVGGSATQGIDISDNDTLFNIKYFYNNGPAPVTFNTPLCDIANFDAESKNVFYCDGLVRNGFKLDIRAFLEGPFNGIDMDPTINDLPDFPLLQPYDQSPWNYAGTESVTSLPNTDVVDWVLIEVRDANNAGVATAATLVTQQAAFLLRDGSIVGLDGLSLLESELIILHQLFVVVWHRNHLGIMSATPLSITNGIYSYDFTSVGQAYLSGQKSLGGGIYGMWAGNANGDGEININDKNVWSIDAAKRGYYPGDMDLNGQVNNQDKNDVWLPNNNLSDQVPD